MIKLSIIMLTVPSRIDNCFPIAVKKLLKQTENRDDVELLALFDNKMRTLGEKRNHLLSLAKGQYIAIFDDDDTPSPEYITEVIKAIDSNPGVDLVTFDMLFIQEGEIRGMYSRHYNYPTCHCFAWRKELAQNIPYPHLNHRVDRIWEIQIAEFIKTRVRIPKILYYYNWNPKKSTQRGTA